jgi:cytosine/adenosine deaminase-related metal-dependent hydrolase
MLRLKARWVLPVSGEPIPNGIVEIEDGRIAAVGPSRAGQGARDLGNVAVLPGLINAHTHLELSGFSEPLGQPGISFIDWIGLVVGARQSGQYDADSAVRSGLEECSEAGVAAVGDIVQAPSSSGADIGSRSCETSEGGHYDRILANPAASINFLELIGPTESRAAEALDAAARHVGAGQGRGAHVGLSPHAPYTIRPELLEGACRISREHAVPVAFHLAESREEMQLLCEGTGPFRELLQRLDVWDPVVHRAGRRPLDFLNLLDRADRALVIHGNYLDADEIAFLGERSDRMSVVYCPRTHAWFRHAPHPLESMLAARVTVALGTDSRASSPDLNLLEEMRSVAQRHPKVSGARIVEMGTLCGARSLGLDAELGSLEPGKLARLAIVDLPGHRSNDPYDLLFDRRMALPDSRRNLR